MSEGEVERLRERERALEAEVARLHAQLRVAAPSGARIAMEGATTTPAGPEELFSAVEKTRMPMILTDPRQPDNPIIFVNRALQKLSGYEAADLIGRNCRFLQGPDTDPKQVAQIRTAIAAREDIALEILNYRRDGTRFINELYISPVFDQHGELLYHFGSQLDITGWRRSRHQLEISETRQRAILDSAVDFGIMVTDRDGRVTDWNIGAERVFGWSAAEMMGETVEDIFTPEDRSEGRVEVEMQQALTQGRSSDERWHLKRDGSRFFAAGEMMPLRDANEEHLGFIKIVRDRTGEHLAGRALEVAEARLRRAQEVGGVGLFSTEIASDITSPTPEFCRLYGLPVQDRYPAKVFEALVVPGDPTSTAATRVDGSTLRDVEYRIHRADTGALRWIARMGEFERDESGRPIRFSGVVRDVTERRLIEAERDRAAADLRELNEKLEKHVADRTAELMRAEEQLRQAQKMEAVGQITGGLAHDFNNLLTGIMGSLDLLGKRVAQGRLNDLDRYLVAANGAAKRAAALTHRLLAFSRRQTLDPRPTDVGRLIGGMADLIRRTVGPAITVETIDIAGLWTALVDPHQLENALLNLAINSRDAMPDGGRLTIETGNKWMDDRASKERDLPPGQYLSVCVSDTGMGMPPDVVARAFEPFFTTKPLGQGTGLGLSMIYGFARQSGGQVRIYTEPDQGTMVCIYLPRHYGDGESQPNRGQDAEAPRAHVGETVLVVDDEPTVRMLVTDVLSDLGYAAIEAEDGPSGLKVVAGTGRIDLLITDVGLPGGMNGRQVADAARALRPGLKVLFITGYAENAAVGNGHLEPGMAVLTKPFAMDDLGTKIRTLIEN